MNNRFKIYKTGIFDHTYNLRNMYDLEDFVTRLVKDYNRHKVTVSIESNSINKKFDIDSLVIGRFIIRYDNNRQSFLMFKDWSTREEFLQLDISSVTEYTRKKQDITLFLKDNSKIHMQLRETGCV